MAHVINPQKRIHDPTLYPGIKSQKWPIKNKSPPKWSLGLHHGQGTKIPKGGNKIPTNTPWKGWMINGQTILCWIPVPHPTVVVTSVALLYYLLEYSEL